LEEGEKMTMIVGIECTAHTFGVGVVSLGRILSNVRDMYVPKDESGGIIPMESANHHKEVAQKVWDESLEIAGISVNEIDAIAVSNAPGLASCLYEGMSFAKKKAEELGVELIGVNHCIAHLEIGRSVGSNDPVLLYASGANTQIIAFSGGKYRVFGETLDLGVGNFIDKTARYFGMGFPGGPKIEKGAVKENITVAEQSFFVPIEKALDKSGVPEIINKFGVNFVDIAKKEFRVLELQKREYKKIFVLVKADDSFYFNAEGMNDKDIEMVKTIEGFETVPINKTNIRSILIAGNTVLENKPLSLPINNFDIISLYGKKSYDLFDSVVRLL